jgi:hypothetical protein
MNIRDEFKGDDAALRASVKALIEISDDGAMAPHPLGCHSRALLAACYCRIGGMVRLDDPVVKELVECLKEAAEDMGFRSMAKRYSKALSAYEARVKSISEIAKLTLSTSVNHNQSCQ